MLKKCNECGEKVSSKADKCPHCGAPVKEKTSLGTGCITLIIGLAFIGWLVQEIGPDREAASSARPVTQRVPTEPRSGSTTIELIQQQLSRAGYDAGSADGVMGPATEAAIRKYQEDRGLQETGTITSELMRSLAESQPMDPTQISLSDRNPVHKLLLNTSDSERAQSLAIAVASSEYAASCDEPRRTFFQGFDKDDVAYWNVTCGEGATYRVGVYPDAKGSTGVVTCDLQAALGAPCYEPLPPE